MLLSYSTLLLLLFVLSLADCNFTATNLSDLIEISKKTYDRLRHCLKDANVNSNGVKSIDSAQLSSDIEDYYSQLLSKTRMFRDIEMHDAAGFHGPWIENHFIEHFLSKPLSYFSGMIPLFVQWTDIHVHSFDDEKAKNVSIPVHQKMPELIGQLLRKDLIYVTVNQDDQGIGTKLSTEWPNILVISAGGFGHIPIPLVKGEMPYTSPPGTFECDVGFYGSIRPRLSRSSMLLEMQSCVNQQGMKYKSEQSPSWESNIRKTKFNLAPRGFGRTSYRLAEVVQSGRVPVYMYDDQAWLPYEGTNISISHFGYAARMGRSCDTAKQLKQTTAVELALKLDNVRGAREHYTYQGILRQLKRFFQRPWDVEGSDLRCVRLPGKDHRRRRTL